ncbi:MAG TPA: DUF3325 domain-containing protein [Bordetella sp.]|jgi:hypothetical protein|nr:DUF3325 domain-containing protein [Bordetella sp.]
MTAWVCGLLAFAGFAAIARSMERHREVDRIGTDAGADVDSAATWRLRGGGYGLLGLAAWAAVREWGPSVGLAAWLGTLTLSAFSLMLLFTYRPAAIRTLARMAALSGLLGWLLPPLI